MKNIALWIVLGAVALFVLGLFGGMLLPFGWNHSGFGYGCANGYGMMGYPGMSMMGGWGRAPFGMFGLPLMWLLPLGTLVLIAVGIFWLVRALTQKQA